MRMEDRYFKFQGFHPSDFTRSYLNDKINALLEESPYGSDLKATFTRQGHLFKGVVTIYSSAGKFFAVASGTKLKEVMQKLVEQIRKQLDRWKSQRFRRESIRDIPFENDTTKELNYDTDSVA
ncbi:MAG: hypothetical protein ACXVCY_08700 [Pseudobdellovibrionaceae bacterium]